jgi:hypothetical protein
MAGIDPKKLEELRAQHGADVVVLEAAGQVVALRRPSRAAYSRFRQLLLDDSRKHTANEALLSDCIIWPAAAAEREAVFDAAPALIDTFAGEAARMAGAGAEAKKL